MNEQLLVWMVYDDANDIAIDGPAELTKLVADGARYFYSVPDSGGSWYVMLATDREMTEDEVQQAWELAEEES